MVGERINKRSQGVRVFTVIIAVTLLSFFWSHAADAVLLKTYNLPGSFPETWYNDVIDLSAYDNHTIKLAFRYLSDDQWAAYFDDILVWDGTTTAHSENFDSYADGYDFDGTAACGFYTQENYGTTCGTYHYAEVEDYKCHSSPNSAEIYYNCPNDDWLFTPEIDLTGLSGSKLDFWYMWDDSWDILFEVHLIDISGPSAAIPTLSEWGMIIFIGLLVVSAFFFLKRRSC
ncbi:MAG TPA: hypothetical protein PK874_13550 [Desulfobacteraceae bacterium]|nr:hypothetical protein [Desulfobacteraceae bacterium]HPJ69182.1 hypothetical protein [Desulfobacteraceae bacterium]HPQ29879.1 hypothetical protein [Desulfobacteraceae bacterium]